MKINRITEAFYKTLNQEHEMSNDNVTPLHKNGPTQKITGRPYAGPTDSIKQVLDLNGFGESVIDRGWVELRIVASFTKDGCMFHTVQASEVLGTNENGGIPEAVAAPMPSTGAETRRGVVENPPSPSFRTLATFGMIGGLSATHYIIHATFADMKILDEEMAHLDDDDLVNFFGLSDDAQDDVAEQEGCTHALEVLRRLHKEHSGG